MIGARNINYRVALVKYRRENLEELYIAYMNYVRKEITNNESISQIK